MVQMEQAEGVLKSVKMDREIKTIWYSVGKNE